jgi:hypothetical protein
MLGRHGQATLERGPDELAATIRAAVESKGDPSPQHRTAIPADQRPEILLTLDAISSPAHAHEAVMLSSWPTIGVGSWPRLPGGGAGRAHGRVDPAALLSFEPAARIDPGETGWTLACQHDRPRPGPRRLSQGLCSIRSQP